MKSDAFVRILIVTLAVLIASSVNAQEASSDEKCAVSIRSSPSFLWRGSAGRGYSGISPSMWEEGVLRVAVESGSCSFALVVDPAVGRLSGASGSLGMTLSDRPGGQDLSTVPVDPLSSPFSGAGSSGDVSEFAVYLTLPAGQVVGAGEYHGGVPVRLFVIEEGIPELVDETVIDISASVGADLSVTSSGFSGGASDVSLGDVSQGFSRSFDFELSGNAPASVSIESLNGGSLKHDDADVMIPYETVLDGRTLDLRPGAHTSSVGLVPGRDKVMTLEIVGRPVGQPVAGDYSDTLTMVFRSDL